MKHSYLLIFIIFIASCTQKNNDSGQLDSFNSSSLDHNKQDKRFLDYFSNYDSSVVEINLSGYIPENKIKESELIPEQFNKYFSPIFAEPSGFKPIGKLILENGNYLLIALREEDYGPIIWGLSYSGIDDKIIDKEKLADFFGDAGDSQITKSIIKLETEILIQKSIETCHAEIEIIGDNAIEKSKVCEDSTTLIIIQQNLKKR